jgi:hypothetical protein
MEDTHVISKYTDEQACEDGTLVAVTPRDRVTSAVWGFVSEHLGDTPPFGWPVGLLAWCAIRDDDPEPGMRRALAATKGLIDVNRTEATRIYEDNIGGGIWDGYIQQGADDVITGFDRTDGPGGDRRVWLMPNELGGLTLMFPEDY